MNVLKAYADAGALGNQNSYAIAPRHGGDTRSRKEGGDFLSLSQAARDMLERDRQNSISVLPQDATYDQNGQVMRQLDSLQGELAHLASQFISSPGTQAMMPQLGALQSRIRTLRAEV